MIPATSARAGGGPPDALTSEEVPETDPTDVPARIKFLLRGFIRAGDMTTLTGRQCKKHVQESFENGASIVREYKRLIKAIIDEEIHRLNRQSPMPQTPSTPGGDHAVHLWAHNWCVEKIEVKVVSGVYVGSTGVVAALEGSDCQVKIHDGAMITVPSEDLELVPAQKNSTVIILRGDLKGMTGKLIGIDGGDGIIKMDLNFDIRIVDMPCVAAYVPG